MSTWRRKRFGLKGAVDIDLEEQEIKSWQTQLSGLIIKGKIVKIGDFGNIWNNFNNIGQELTHISNTTIGRYVNCQENNIALIALFFVIYLVFFFSYSAVEFK